MLRSIALFVMLMAGALQAAEKRADLILHNGHVVTVDEKMTVAKAVAVGDGKILAVGDDAAVLKLRGPSTEVIDLSGKTVLPGLIDSHVHPGSASMHEFDHPIPVMESIADVLAYVPTKTAQQAIFDAAMAADAGSQDRVAMLNAVSTSAKRTGNQLTERQVASLLELVTKGGDAEATAAASLMGALNLPNANIVPLILGRG